MTKPDLTTEIRTAVNVLNALVKEAKLQDMKVAVQQDWGYNKTITVTITSKLIY